MDCDSLCTHDYLGDGCGGLLLFHSSDVSGFRGTKMMGQTLLDICDFQHYFVGTESK